MIEPKGLKKGTPEWYRAAFEMMQPLERFSKTIDAACARIIKGKKRYQKVAEVTGVPWFVIGGLHNMEASGSFLGVLHNGEHIIGTGRKTKLVPAGRGPFSTWEEAAIDAIKLNGARWARVKSAGPEIGELLKAAEQYNGTGYLKYRQHLNTPYLWAQSNVCRDTGKYVADGKFSETAPAHGQVGFATLMKRLEMMGEIKLQRLGDIDELPKKIETPKAKAESDAEILLDLAHDAGIPLEPIERMIAMRDKKYPKSRPRYWAAFNAGLHSKHKRLWIFDVKEKTVKSYHATHGSGSDVDHNGVAEKFSNQPGSNATCLGVARCMQTRQCPKHGYEMQMDGLETSNSNMRQRLILIHKAPYAEESYVKRYGKTGRSQGCIVIGDSVHRDLIDKLKMGSFIVTFK